MKLKVKKETYFVVNYGDLSEFITKFYNLENYFDAASIEEVFNGMNKQYAVSERPLSVYEERDLNNFLNCETGSYILHVLLQDMCSKGAIEPGDYLVEFCW